MFPVLQGLQAWVGSEPTPSESLVTSDDEAVRTKPTSSSSQHPTAGTHSHTSTTAYMYILSLMSAYIAIYWCFLPAVISASPHSTPPHSRSDETPFAADNIGDTVIRLDKVLCTHKALCTHLHTCTMLLYVPCCSMSIHQAMARLRESYLSRGSPGAMRPPVISPGPLASADLSQSSQSESTVSWNDCTHTYIHACSMHCNSVRRNTIYRPLALLLIYYF